MAFTELNSVEYYVIHQLSGVNQSEYLAVSFQGRSAFKNRALTNPKQIGNPRQFAAKRFALTVQINEF